MALNPFFLQGSQSEQRLIQELVNEQLTIYGVEVVYLPRKIVKQDNILNEIESSKFSDNYAIEAYVNTYDGYGGAGDIMTKFGISLKDELTITISKERFEDFISPFLGALNDNNDDEINVFTRPREGDLIYFPLGKRFFEVKFVEHEQPFYQLGKNYVYQLKCELFELEDELGGWDQVSTSNNEIDELVESVGYLTTLRLIGIGTTASVGLSTATGYIRKITLTNDGSGYTKVPTVAISTAPSGGINATAVAITTSINNVFSVKEILITNAGAGYTATPTVNIVSAIEDIVGVGTTTHGVGAAAKATLVTDSVGIRQIQINNAGSGYSISPSITFGVPTGVGSTTAVGKVILNIVNNTVSEVRISDAGIGYDSLTATATIDSPPLTVGVGTFKFNEVVTGSRSGAKGRVKSWDGSKDVLQLGTTDGTFVKGDTVTGEDSGAVYVVNVVESPGFNDKYDKGDEIETEADTILDFTESNPFGTY